MCRIPTSVCTASEKDGNKSQHEAVLITSGSSKKHIHDRTSAETESSSGAIAV